MQKRETSWSLLLSVHFVGIWSGVLRGAGRARGVADKIIRLKKPMMLKKGEYEIAGDGSRIWWKKGGGGESDGWS